MPEILAHQGGWDEILLVAGPLAVFGGALWLANRRANARLAERAHDSDAEAPDGIPDEAEADGPDSPG